MNIEIIREILPFANTEEAIVFGQSMNEEMKAEMEGGIQLHTENARLATKNKHWDAASLESFMSQLCRESVEAYEGKLKLRGQT